MNATVSQAMIKIKRPWDSYWNTSIMIYLLSKAETWTFQKRFSGTLKQPR